MIKEIIKKILVIIPIGRVIMLESAPDLSDNTMAVFEEMLRRGMNKSYKFVWWVNDIKKDLPKYENVTYVDRNTRLNRLKFTWYRLRSKCMISCNKFIGRMSEKQIEFYLCHGTILKSVRQYYTLPDNISYVLIASEYTKDLMAHELNVNKEKVYAFGFPRNDVMGKIEKNMRGYFKTQYKKIIVWYPTFRQHKNGGNQTCCTTALPILHNTEMAYKLNEVAQKNDILIVIKPHFAQDIAYIKDYNMSNITFIDDEFFMKNGITSYEFVASSDALITDYSSIYFDYLLCDKPMAVIWEDIEEYKKNPGFAINLDETMKGASKIYNIDEFMAFIEDVANENDTYKKFRKEISEWANFSTDGKNSKRVVDFIIKKADL